MKIWPRNADCEKVVRWSWLSFYTACTHYYINSYLICVIWKLLRHMKNHDARHQITFPRGLAHPRSCFINDPKASEIAFGIGNWELHRGNLWYQIYGGNRTSRGSVYNAKTRKRYYHRTALSLQFCLALLLLYLLRCNHYKSRFLIAWR